MDTLRQDLFYTIRGLARSPGFAAVVFFTLALGIGANTAIFSVVKGVLLDPLPYRDPERLVQLYEKRPRQGRIRNVVSAPDFIDWKEQNTVFDGMSAVTGAAFTLPAEDGAQLLFGLRVTTDFFAVFGIKPVMGRTFLPEEQTPGKDRVVLLAQGLWQRQFGADPSIVGRKIMLSGEPYLVIGVIPQMPDMFAGKTEVWQPLVLSPQASRGRHFLNVYARMKPGISLAQTRADMDVVAGRLESQFADANTGHGVNVFSLEEELTGSVRPALLVLMGAVGLVLLVACANVANLYMARTVQRRREISIRTALGAGSGRLMRQLLTESLLVSLVGGAAAIALAFWGVQLLVAANPGNLPRLHNIRIDGTVLLFTVGIATLTAVLFGLAPALQAAKTEIGGALKESSRGSTEGLARNTTRRLLVMTEVALALVLAIGSGLMIRSFGRLTAVHPGFDTDNVLALDLSLMGPRYTKSENRSAFLTDLLSRLRGLPGVVSAAGTSALPLTGRDGGSNFVISGRPPLPYSQQPNARWRIVTSDYFATLRIPLRSGRLLDDRDTATSPPVLLINETMARQYFPDENPIGKRISISGEKEILEIVGMVGDVKHYSLAGETRPEMYFPYAQKTEGFMSMVIRTASSPETLIGTVRSQFREVDKDQPIITVRTLEDLLSISVAQPRLYSILLTIFSGLALLLAAVGIYGVMSFAVGQRKQEMGIRMALGARAGSVRGLVLREGMTLAIAGVALGIVSSFVLMRVLERLLFGITPTDPVAFLGAATLLLAVAMAACYFPARRATRVDPILVLRSE